MGVTDVCAIDTHPSTEGTNMGRVREGNSPLSSGGYGGSVPDFRVSEKQSEALLRLFSQTILKENKPFLYF